MVQRDGLVAATPRPTASWGMRLATMRPAHGGLIDRRTRPNYGPGRVISRARTAVHLAVDLVLHILNGVLGLVLHVLNRVLHLVDT